MNIGRSRLDELMAYYNYTRRAGHTTFMMEGINFNRPAVMLFASNSHAQGAFRDMVDRYEVANPNFVELKIGQVRFATIGFLNRLEENLRGRDHKNLMPIIVDHFAMQVLLDEDRKLKKEQANANN